MILDASGKQIAGAQSEAPARMVEVVRSFSFKKNLGNYQSCDFFCSQKAQCEPDQVDEVSSDLYEWCMDQVMSSVKDIENRMEAKKEAATARRSNAA